MSLTVTSLNGAVTQGSNRVVLTAFTNPSNAGIGARTILEVDSEKMLVTDATNSPTLLVVRGYQGTLATAHNTLAPVTYGVSSDFTANGAQGVSGSGSIAVAKEATYSVNGAITNPLVDQTIYITKAGVCALTLSSPNADQTNVVRFVALTANAHTITYTPGFYGNTTSSDVATFPATKNGSFTVEAQNGLWAPLATAASGVTFG